MPTMATIRKSALFRGFTRRVRKSALYKYSGQCASPHHARTGHQTVHPPLPLLPPSLPHNTQIGVTHATAIYFNPTSPGINSAINYSSSSASRRLSEKFFTEKSNPSVGEPVCRVSDEGGFWASTAVRPRAARQPRERQKPTEVGDGTRRQKATKTIVNKGRIQISTPPHVGKGVGIP